MRVLHLVHQYVPEYVGGTERYTRMLAEELCHQGHDATILYRCSKTEEGMDFRLDDGVKVWRAWNGVVTPSRRFLATFGDSSLQRAFEMVLEETHPELIHVQHLMGWPVSVLSVIHALGLPYMVTLHDYWWVCANGLLITNYSQRLCDGPRAYFNCTHCALARAGHPGWWPAALPLVGLLEWRGLKLRRFLRESTALVAPSEFVKTWYVNHGIPANKLHVIPHGTPSFSQPHQKIQAGLVRFAYIGALAWHKGVHIALEAFRGLQAQVELWVAGDEAFDVAYSHYLRTLATPKVHFLGRLTHSEIGALLSEVDVVLIPSLCYESFSLVVREAFAAGVPVIVSDLGALAEAVQDGVDGLRVPAGDVGAWRAALQRLIAEPELHAHLRKGVRPPLTLSEHVDRLERLYLQCVDSKVSA